MTRDLSRGPALRFPPVVLFVIGFAVGLVADIIRPLPVFGRLRYWVIAGAMLIALGIGFATWACLLFMRMKTAIYPTGHARQLVVSGPYRFTRNPMYVAMSAAHAGLALMFQLLWTLALLPVVMIVCYRLVIRREENYLEAEFGGAYWDYKRRVRRWL
jgi:protein-S-isoprenylcysteine O-methyltransferase Ste14